MPQERSKNRCAPPLSFSVKHTYFWTTSCCQSTKQVLSLFLSTRRGSAFLLRVHTSFILCLLLGSTGPFYFYDSTRLRRRKRKHFSFKEKEKMSNFLVDRIEEIFGRRRKLKCDGIDGLIFSPTWRLVDFIGVDESATEEKRKLFFSSLNSKRRRRHQLIRRRTIDNYRNKVRKSVFFNFKYF